MVETIWLCIFHKERKWIGYLSHPCNELLSLDLGFVFKADSVHTMPAEKKTEGINYIDNVFSSRNKQIFDSIAHLPFVSRVGET